MGTALTVLRISHKLTVVYNLMRELFQPYLAISPVVRGRDHQATPQEEEAQEEEQVHPQAGEERDGTPGGGRVLQTRAALPQQQLRAGPGHHPQRQRHQGHSHTPTPLPGCVLRTGAGARIDTCQRALSETAVSILMQFLIYYNGKLC